MSRAQEQLARALYAQHAAAAYPHALIATNGARDQARCILRAALSSAVRHPAAVAEDGARSWLVTEVRRIADSTPPGSGPRRRRARTNPAVLVPSPPPDTNADLHGRERSSPIAESLAELPANYRTAIVESFLKGRTVQQAAEFLGLAPQAVKSRIHYGLHRLILLLEERESAE